jgi:hypothetical protein
VNHAPTWLTPSRKVKSLISDICSILCKRSSLILEEAEMSQIENAVTSSSKEKRSYRKGKPMSASERQLAALRVNVKRIKK